MKARVLNLYIGVMVSLLAYLAVALALTFSQRPIPNPVVQKASFRLGSVVEADYSDLPELSLYTARDGSELAFRRYPSARATNKVLVLLHGSAWHSMQFHPLASFLSESGLAHVVTPDLRGHGFAPERRGDVDYLGQLEDDVGDIVRRVKALNPGKIVLLGGHSSGGGLAVRFAGSRYADLVDGYVLLAPFLKHNAPTTRPDAGGWARPLQRRIVGLTMLNKLGVRWFNHLTVIQFNLPAAVLEGPLGETATTAYSYRLNTSFAPRSRYGRDLAAMRQPFLLVAGTADPSFIAEQYEPTIAPHTSSGTYLLLRGVGHIELLTTREIQPMLASWLKEGGGKGLERAEASPR